MEKILENAIEKLAAEFENLDLTFHKMENAKPDDVTSFFRARTMKIFLFACLKAKKFQSLFTDKIFSS